MDMGQSDINRKDNDMKLQKAHLVATYETQKELNDYFNIHNDEEKRLLYLGSALTWNMLAHMLEKQEDE